MERKTLTISVPKETYELALGIATFTASVIDARKDGWSNVDDIPTVVRSAITHLLPAIDGIENIPMELREVTREDYINLAMTVGSDFIKIANPGWLLR